jgi:hypothetical protein
MRSYREILAMCSGVVAQKKTATLAAERDVSG